MRHCLAILSLIMIAFAVEAGARPPLDEKAVVRIEEGPLYLGSINSGFKANDEYFDANLNLVAPVWSSLGSDGLLGGGIVFLEPYVSWGEQGEVATSLGLGWRYLFNDQPVSALRSPREDQAGFWDEGIAIGANFFVDMLDTEADNQFWQLGFGLELATRYIELRGNYYLPLTDKQLAERKTFTETRTSSKTTTKPVTQTSAPYDDGQGFLVQDQTTSLVSTTTITTTEIRHILERYEEGMEGWDAEIAVLVPGLDKYCDVKVIGGYFSLDNAPFGPQEGGTGNVEGWKAGIEVRPVPAVALTTMWYEDERFLGSNWMFGARMEIPFEASDLGDGKGMWGRIRDAFTPRRRHLVERLAEPVHRQNAAIHIASKSKASSKVSKQSTSSSVHVVSQTKSKIVLGPGPSGTDFTYASSGTLEVNGSTVNGSMFVNRAGQSLFVENAGGIVLFASDIGASNGTVVQSLVGSTMRLAANVFSSNLGAGTPFNLPSGDITRFTLLNPTSSSTINNSIATSAGSTLTLSASNTYSGSSSIASLIGSGAITLNAVSGGTVGGTTLTLSGSGLRLLPAYQPPTVTNVGGATEVIVNSGVSTLNLNTVLIGSGGLTKVGSGLIVLSGTSGLSGGITVSAGTLTASSWASLGSTGIVTIGQVSGSGTVILPRTSSSTSLEPTQMVIQQRVLLNGTSLSAGTYNVTNGVIFTTGGSPLTLSGAILTAPPTP